MNRRGFARRPGRSLESDVLTLHLVLGAALSGRTTPAHAARAARRAAQSARAALQVYPMTPEQSGAAGVVKTPEAFAAELDRWRRWRLEVCA